MGQDCSNCCFDKEEQKTERKMEKFVKKPKVEDVGSFLPEYDDSDIDAYQTTNRSLVNTYHDSKFSILRQISNETK